jgi:tetratricopeptide (TPR) repeat protein
MTSNDTPEYRKLALDSSNDLIRYDSRWILGEYTSAAFHALKAGIARREMGKIKFKEKDFTQTAADWLCAVHCFSLATRPQLVRTTLDWVLKVEKEGKIPRDRRDLYVAIAEREEEYKKLEQRITELQRDVQRAGSSITGGQETLDQLLRWLRELPGFWKLHALIFLQAQQLGQLTRAIEHLDWADKLFPGDQRVALLRVFHLFLRGEFNQAARVGEEALGQNSSAPLRYLVALALVSSSVDHPPDAENALEMLTPLLNDSADMSGWRLLGLALSVSIHHDLNRDSESDRYLGLFNRLFDSLPVEDRNRYAKLRELANQSAPEQQLRNELLHLNEMFLISKFRDPGDISDEPPFETEQTAQLAIA